MHALLGVASQDALLGHPVAGLSWACFVIENLLAAAAQADHPAQASFYRSAAGAEIDLLLAWPDGRTWAIEVKRSLSPKLERGFHHACADVQPQQCFVVYPGQERYRLAEDIEAIPLGALVHQLGSQPSKGSAHRRRLDTPPGM